MIATDVRPRVPDIPGIDHPSVVSYVDVLDRGGGARRPRRDHRRAGGIGFDVAEFLVGDAAKGLKPATFFAAWDLDVGVTSPGGGHRPTTQPQRRCHADDHHGTPARLIGGAHLAAELDAVAAIDEATRRALAL